MKNKQKEGNNKDKRRMHGNFLKEGKNKESLYTKNFYENIIRN